MGIQSILCRIESLPYVARKEQRDLTSARAAGSYSDVSNPHHSNPHFDRTEQPRSDCLGLNPTQRAFDPSGPDRGRDQRMPTPILRASRAHTNDATTGPPIPCLDRHRGDAGKRVVIFGDAYPVVVWD